MNSVDNDQHLLNSSDLSNQLISKGGNTHHHYTIDNPKSMTGGYDDPIEDNLQNK